MTATGHAKSFRDLKVYQKAFEVSYSVFILTLSFPKEEIYSLTDQIRRSSRAVGAMLAECWAKRRYKSHFISKLTDADAEQLETQHWIDIAVACGYLDKEQATELLNKLAEVGYMLNAMIERADQFCGRPSTYVKENYAEYHSSIQSFFAEPDQLP
ncbi:MAG: four helix bundle protein [Armatimonadota bacterium]